MWVWELWLMTEQMPDWLTGARAPRGRPGWPPPLRSFLRYRLSSQLLLSNSDWHPRRQQWGIMPGSVKPAANLSSLQTQLGLRASMLMQHWIHQRNYSTQNDYRISVAHKPLPCNIPVSSCETYVLQTHPWMTLVATSAIYCNNDLASHERTVRTDHGAKRRFWCNHF